MSFGSELPILSSLSSLSTLFQASGGLSDYQKKQQDALARMYPAVPLSSIPNDIFSSGGSTWGDTALGKPSKQSVIEDAFKQTDLYKAEMGSRKATGEVAAAGLKLFGIAIGSAVSILIGIGLVFLGINMLTSGSLVQGIKEGFANAKAGL